ncbi:hypothetical protein Mapa_005494 [Marchantia paleacea]|nr:hypothetical protein Mapa_005494 [Marchantia paleacea]
MPYGAKCSHLNLTSRCRFEPVTFCFATVYLDHASSCSWAREFMLHVNSVPPDRGRDTCVVRLLFGAGQSAGDEFQEAQDRPWNCTKEDQE